MEESRFVPRVAYECAEGIRYVDYSDGASPFSTHGSNSQNLELLCLLWVSLLSDSPADCSRKPNRLFKRFVARFERDPLALILQYSSLYDRLVHSLNRDDQGNVTIDVFIDEFRDTPIFWEYHKFFVTKDPLLLRFISSFLLFGKKSYYEDEAFNAKAFRDWLDVEKRLSGIELSDHHLQNLSYIMSWIFEDIDTQCFLPAHGSGAVAERGVRTIAEKNSLLYDSFLSNALFEFDVNVGPTIRDHSGRISDEADARASRLKFVPKDIGKARSICMEPAVLQWAQQGVRLWIEKALSDRFGTSVPFRDQGVSRAQARIGSIRSDRDTIDLQSASDSVLYSLIEGIMPDEILGYLEVTRSMSVLTPDGESVEVLKFAPMGSALCFPIQCSIYAAVIIYCGLAWEDDKSPSEYRVSPSLLSYNFNRLFKRGRLLRPFTVFGDDIICDSRITSRVTQVLGELGFVVNSEKSFVGSQAFRESCGGFYFDGSDVTPLRAKFKSIKDTPSLLTVASLIDMANRAYDYGYTNLRMTLIRFCLYTPIQSFKRSGKREPTSRNPILFSDDRDDSLAIYHPRPHNKHLRHRLFDASNATDDTRSWYQRDEVRSLSIRTVDPVPIDDWYRHIQWWRSRYRGASNSDVPRETPRNTRLCWRWTCRPG